ncbi:unnamed protein product [Ilex paraguariensis]|uniref:Uncharacterized protein n=1 Tax=Ilex paraguariensis TaxID=185542 RepID=A0ABC8U0K6_9AQUA
MKVWTNMRASNWKRITSITPSKNSFTHVTQNVNLIENRTNELMVACVATPPEEASKDEKHVEVSRDKVSKDASRDEGHDATPLVEVNMTEEVKLALDKVVHYLDEENQSQTRKVVYWSNVPIDITRQTIKRYRKKKVVSIGIMNGMAVARN